MLPVEKGSVDPRSVDPPYIALRDIAWHCMASYLEYISSFWSCSRASKIFGYKIVLESRYSAVILN